MGAQLTPAQRAALAKRLGREPAAPTATRIVPRAEGVPVPLSALQYSLWLVDQMHPGTIAYNQLSAATITGPLRADLLTEAFRIVVRRHEALRSTVTLGDDGLPLARIHDDPVELEYLVRTTVIQCERDDTDDRLREYAREPFDLGADVPVRFVLLVHGPDEATLGLCAHHIGLDNLSAAIVLREMAQCYLDLLATGTSSLDTPAPLQYGDYAIWQHAHLGGPRGETLRNYWHQRLARVRPVLELPFDLDRPTSQSFQGARTPIEAPTNVVQAVVANARTLGVTPYMYCFAACAVLLHRWSGQESFAIGTPIAGRDRTELEPLVGFLNNTLAIGFDFRGATTWRGVLAETRQNLVDAFGHAELPIDRVVEAVRPPRSPGVNPLFQVNFRLAPPAAAPIDHGPLEWRRRTLDLRYSKFDLALELHLEGDRLGGHVEYNAALFRPETAAAVSAAYTNLLATVSDDPDVEILAIEALDTSPAAPRRSALRRRERP